MSRNDQIVYSGESNVRRLLDMVAGSEGASIEFLNSHIVPEPVIRFSGDYALHHATRFAQHVARCEGMAVEVCEISAKSRQEGYAATFNRRTSVMEIDPRSEILDALLVCHELAHAVSDSHTAAFQQRYVELVREYVGPAVGLLLQHELFNPTMIGTSREGH